MVVYKIDRRVGVQKSYTRTDPIGSGQTKHFRGMKIFHDKFYLVYVYHTSETLMQYAFFSLEFLYNLKSYLGLFT